MEDRTRNLIVAVTALFGLAGLALMLMMFGYAPRWLEGGYYVNVELPTAGGLTAGSRARLSGIHIGRVVEVDLLAPPKTGVEAKVHVRKGVRIPAEAKVHVVNPLLAGNPSLAFEIQGLEPAQLEQTLPTDNTARLSGQTVTLTGELQQQLQQQGEMLQGQVDQANQTLRQAANDFSEIRRSFAEVSEQWSQVGRNVNQMIEPRDPVAVDDGNAAPNLNTVLVRADARLSQMRTVLEQVDHWLTEARQTTSTVRSTAERIGDSADSMGRTSDQVRTDLQRLSGRYTALADDLSGLIGQAQQMVRQAEQGQGTTGKMLHDPALYNNLNDAAQRMGSVLDEFKLLIDKWRAEGLVQF